MLFGLFGAKKPQNFDEFIESMTLDEGASYIEYLIKMSRTAGGTGVKVDTYKFIHFCDDFGKDAVAYAKYFAKKGSGDAAFYLGMFYEYGLFVGGENSTLATKYHSMAKKNNSKLEEIYSNLIPLMNHSYSQELSQMCTKNEAKLLYIYNSYNSLKKIAYTRSYDDKKWKAGKYYCSFNNLGDRFESLINVIITKNLEYNPTAFSVLIALEGAIYGAHHFGEFAYFAAVTKEDAIKKYKKEIFDMAKNGDEKARYIISKYNINN